MTYESLCSKLPFMECVLQKIGSHRRAASWTFPSLYRVESVALSPLAASWTFPSLYRVQPVALRSPLAPSTRMNSIIDRRPKLIYPTCTIYSTRVQPTVSVPHQLGLTNCVAHITRAWYNESKMASKATRLVWANPVRFVWAYAPFATLPSSLSLPPHLIMGQTLPGCGKTTSR